MPKNLAQQLGSYAKQTRRAPGETEIEFQGKGKDMSIKSKTTDAGTIKYNKNLGKPVGKLETLKYVPSVIGDALKKIPKPSRHSDRYNYQQQRKRMNKK